MPTAAKPKNTRVSHPRSHIDNIVAGVPRGPSVEGDFFHVDVCLASLPPVSRLTTEQMQYHSVGFHLEAGGTECGITQPTPTSPPAGWRGVLLRHPVRQRTGSEDGESGRSPGWSTPAGTARANACRCAIPAASLARSSTAPTGSSCGEGASSRCSVLRSRRLLQGRQRGADPRNGWSSADKWQEKAESPAQPFMDNFAAHSDTEAGARLLAGPQLQKSAVEARSAVSRSTPGADLLASRFYSAKSAATKASEAITHPLIPWLRAPMLR